MADAPIDFTNSMSPKEATARLEHLKQTLDGAPPTTTPANAVEGAARLHHLMSGKDPEWIARFNAGNPETVREFHALTKMKAEANPADLAMAGAAPSHLEFELRTPGTATLREMVEAVPHLRELFPDDAIKQLLSAVPADVREYAAAWKKSAMSDPEFVRVYLGGDVETRKQMAACNAILSSGVEKAK
jgi:hypothetical protein